MRFGICTAAMLVYYVLFSVHATYDMVHSEGQTTSAADAATDGVEQRKIMPV
jgi:hypothetical protein